MQDPQIQCWHSIPVVGLQITEELSKIDSSSFIDCYHYVDLLFPLY